jgi:hypothetical protein
VVIAKAHSRNSDAPQHLHAPGVTGLKASDQSAIGPDTISIRAHYRSGKYMANFSRIPEPLLPHLCKPQVLRVKGSPFSITSVDEPPCVRISSESFSSVSFTPASNLHPHETKLIAYRAETAMAQITREKLKRLDDARSLLRQLYRTAVIKASPWRSVRTCGSVAVRLSAPACGSAPVQ